MGSYARKVKRQNENTDKAPRCCGRHMFMNKYGLYQCRKCGRQKFPIGKADTTVTLDNDLNTNVITPQEEDVEVAGVVRPSITEIIDTNVSDENTIE